jgi:hypothetical protein
VSLGLTYSPWGRSSGSEAVCSPVRPLPVFAWAAVVERAIQDTPPSASVSPVADPPSITVNTRS